MFRFLTFVTMFVAVTSVSAADLNPKAINIQLPKDIKWVANPGAGAEQAVLVGDPTNLDCMWSCRNGCRTTTAVRIFIRMTDTSRCYREHGGLTPGPKYDPAGFKPVPAGSFVVHYGKEIHYDGAKESHVSCRSSEWGPQLRRPPKKK